METFFSKIFDWNTPLTEGKRLYFRVLEIILGLQIMHNIWGWAFYIQDLTEVVLPLGLANYLNVSYMFGSNLPILNAGIITVLLVIGFLRKWKHSYLLALLFFHLQYAARFSQGEISHGTNLGGIILLSIGASFSVVQKEEDVLKTALGLIYFFVGLGYMSAAFSKLIGTGLHWADGEHLRLWIAERGTDVLSQEGVFKLNVLQRYLLEYTWAATLTLSFGLLVELGGFLLWFRKTRWIQATLLVSMHVGVVATLNIYFSDYVYLLLFIGYPWDLLLEKVAKRVPILKII